jgi:ribosomal protein S18 acetylase RimI-like enzyme
MTQAQYSDFMGAIVPPYVAERATADHVPAEVGGVWFWIDVENKQGFLYNITVFPRHRRRGFASDALVLIEEMVRAAGCTALGLNVFSSNDAAIALYRKVGFSAVSSYWNKPL